MHYLKKEKTVRDQFNKLYSYETKKQRLEVGRKGAKHEFDLYQKGQLIGGVSTSPWHNKSGTNNTGGQDRASAELLWLSLWNGKERRIHILTDLKMAKNLYSRYIGTPFRKPIEIMHYDQNKRKFSTVGKLGKI